MTETELRIPLERIKNDDEKFKHEEILNLYLKEINLKSTKSKRLNDINSFLNEKLNKEVRSEEDEREIYNASVKSRLLKDDEYESRLIDNIRAEVFMIQEYELRKKYPTFGRVLLGWSRGEEDAKKLLGYIILRETGRATMPNRMNVNYQCLAELVEQYDSSFVETNVEQIKKELDESKSVSLIPYDDRAFFKIAEEASNNLIREVDNKVNGFTLKKSEDYIQQPTGNVKKLIEYRKPLEHTSEKEKEK